jgi:hypothetical protein
MVPGTLLISFVAAFGGKPIFLFSLLATALMLMTDIHSGKPGRFMEGI